VVLTVFAALSSGVRAKVEHIPAMRRPDILAAEELANQSFMINGLIFLGIVAAFRIGIVPIQRFAAVFADADGRIRIFRIFGLLIRDYLLLFGWALAQPCEYIITY